MVREGRLNVAESIVLIHENISTSDTGKLFLYGVYNDKRVPLVFAYDTAICGDDSDSIPAGSWYEVDTVATGGGPDSALPTGAADGDIYYTDSAVTLTAATGGNEEDDRVRPLLGVSCNTINPVGPVASIFNVGWAPCETLYYEVHDAENISSLYSATVNMRMPADVHGEND